jgi:hypothetical protein
VAHIYFDYKEKAQQEPADVLSSLVRPLAGQTAELPQELEGLFEELQPRKARPSLEELYDMLLSVAKHFSVVYIVCDALDECDKDKLRTDLLPKFIHMGQSGLNLFMTSRSDIPEWFDGVEKIELCAQKEDLRTYIETKIKTDPRARSLIGGSKYADMIVSELVDAASGM